MKYVYGRNPVKEELKFIKSGKLYLQKSLKENDSFEIEKKALAKEIEVIYEETHYFNSHFAGKNHQGVVLEIEEDFVNYIVEKDFMFDSSYLEEGTFLILDGIKDVGNLGAILRSAALFDVKTVIMPKDNSAPINDIVMKRSSGALAHLKIVSATNIVRIIEYFKENSFWIYGADMSGTEIRGVDFSEKRVIVLGEEGRGLRPLVKKNCDVLINIKTNNIVDSLNVSVAAGIILSNLYQ